MAELNSTTYAAQLAAQQSAGNIIGDSQLLSGDQNFLQGEWLVPAGTGAADTVNLCYCPANATLVPGSTVTASGAAGASTIDLALADGTVIAAGIDVSAAGTALIPMEVGNVINTVRQAIVATISGTVTADVTIWFNFTYTEGE